MIATLPILSPEEVRDALDPVGAIAAVENALRGGLDPGAERLRQVVGMTHGQLFFMPAESAHAVGVKLLGLAPDNPEAGLPRIQGVYLLLDRTTLTPRAILDGAALTVVRTPAVSFAAVRDPLLRRAGDLHVVIFGRGPQAEAHRTAIEALCSGRRRIASVTVGSRAAPVPAEVLARAGLVICATTARTPLFAGSALDPDAVVVAVGSHEPDAREIDADTMRGATVIVESRAAALREAGDVVLAIDEDAISAEDLVELSDVVRGSRRLPPTGRIVFKSVGMAWEDLVVADAVVAATRGRGWVDGLTR